MQDLIAPAVLAGAVALAIRYWLMTSHWLARWRRESPPDGSSPQPPVTFLRPLKRDATRLLEHLGVLARAMRPDDQLVLGVDEATRVALEEWRARFPERDIAVIACAPDVASNPKIAKLVQMTPHARHAHWIVSDSETSLDADFLEAFRAEWAGTGADALTAGYRIAGLRTWPQELDAASVLLTLWPGLATLRRFGKMRLALGACTALRSEDVAAVGGWAAFADDLAEDNRLGVALARAGRTVRLGTTVVTLASDALGWREYWRHQRRVAVTYGVSNPGGFAGSIVTHGLSLALLVTVCSHPLAPALGAALFGWAWLLRWHTARENARALNFPIPRLGRVVLLASFVETACWLLAWFSRRVWWAGKWRRISWRGKLG